MGRRFALVFGLVLCLYAPRTFRTLCLTGDSAELVTAATLGGIPHAPGYPLYVISSHLLAHLPRLELPFRVHLGSALFHAAAVGAVACAIARVTGSAGAALLGAATLALGRGFFAGSLYAEVFPLNDLFFAWLLYLALRVADPTDDRRAAPWLSLAGVTGLGLSHHPMIALGFPALAILIAPAARRLARESPRHAIGLASFCLAIPVACYALLLVAARRDPWLSWGDVHDVRSLLHLLTRQDYGGLLHASRRPATGQLLERLDAYVVSTAKSFGPGALLLAATGAVAWLGRARRIGVALIVAVVLAGPAFAAANAVDLHSEYRLAFVERFFTMSHVPLSILVGLGAARAFEWLREAPNLGRGWRAPLLAGLGALLTVGPLFYRARDLDFSRERLAAAYARDLVTKAPERSLVLLKGDMSTQAALYECGVEQACGQRIVLAPLQLSMKWRLEQVRRRNPELALTDLAPTVAELVERGLAQGRAVFVHPELLDDAQRGQESALPSLLLFRIYPSDGALRSELPDFHRSLTAIATGTSCEGCMLPRSEHLFPAADAQLRAAYRAALEAHVAAAEQLGFEAESRPLAILAATQ